MTNFTKFQQGGNMVQDIPIVQTDYNFLNYSLSRMNSEYEAGVSNVRNMYNSVLNSPLSNQENVEKRQQYLDQAKQNLQKITKSDLSVPQNQQTAASIFKPFYEDNDIVHDMSVTKQVNSEIQKGYSASTSPDIAIRNTYNKESTNYLQGILQDLGQAHRGDGSIQAIKAESWTPFKDIPSDLSKMAKDEGLEFKQTINGGWNLYEISGGIKSQKNFARWAASKLGPEYTPQLNVIASNQIRSQVNALTSIGVSPEDAKTQIGKQNLDEYVKENNKYLFELNADYNNNSQELNNLEKKIRKSGGNPLQVNEWVSKKRDLDESYGLIEKYTKNSNDYLDQNAPVSYGKTISDVVDYNSQASQVVIKNPNFIAADRIRTNILNNWATGYALGHYSEKTIANQGYANEANYNLARQRMVNDENENNYQHGQDDREYKLELANTALAYQKEGLDFKANDNGGFTTSYPNPYDSKNDIGASSKQFSQMSEAQLSDLKNDQVNNFIKQSLYSNSAENKGFIPELFDAYGVLKPEESSKFFTYMQKLENNEKPIATSDINDIFKKLYTNKVISGNWKNTLEDESSSIREDMLKFAENKLTGMSSKIAPSERQRLLASLDQLETNINVKKSHEFTIQQNIANELKKDKSNTLASFTTTDSNTGNIRIINSKDMSNYLNDIKVVSNEGKVITLSKKQIADAYFNKSITSDMIEGEPYFDVTVDGKTYYTFSDWEGTQKLSSVFNKFGDPESFVNKKNDLYKKVDPWAQQLKSETGKYGEDFNEPMDQPATLKTIQSIGKPSNYLNIVDRDGKSLKDDTKALNAIAALTSDDSKLLKQNVGSITSNPLGYGRTPTITLHLNTTDPSDNADIKYLQKNVGNEITFEIDPNTKDPRLKEYVRRGIQPKEEIFPQLREGHIVKSTGIRNSMDAGYEIHPDATDPRYVTGYTANYDYVKFDPKTGNFTKVTDQLPRIPLDARSQDILDNINKKQYEHSQANDAAYLMYVKNHPKVSIEDLNNNYNDYIKNNK